MLVFTSIRDIPESILEQLRIKQVVKYNLSSFYIDGIYLNGLIPLNEYIPEEVLEGNGSSNEFDINYHNYIFNNQTAFMSFMKMIIPVYNDPETIVQVLIHESEYRNCILESLVKLIQQRYGYNSYIIHDINDFWYMEEQKFNIPGLFNMDNDLHIYNMLFLNYSP